MRTFRHKHASQVVFVFSSKKWEQLCLVIEPGSLLLTNSYGGAMDGRLRVGLFWSGFWRHGLRWIYQNQPA